MGRGDLTDRLRRVVRVEQSVRGTWWVVQGVLWVLAAGVAAVVIRLTLPRLPPELALAIVGMGALWGVLSVLAGVWTLRHARALSRAPSADAWPWDHAMPRGASVLYAAMQAPHVTPAPRLVVLRSTSLRGPAILTALGGVAVLGAVACTVIAAVAGVGVVRLADEPVVTSDGRPGATVLASAPAPGTVGVELTAGERYDVHLVAPASLLGARGLFASVRLVAPSGDTVVADGSVTRSLHRTRWWQSSVIGTFTATESGRYVMTVPDVGGTGAWAALAPAPPAEDVAAGSAGAALSALSVLAATGLWGGGLVTLLAGVTWGAVRLLVRWGARRRPGGPDAAVTDAAVTDAGVTDAGVTDAT